MRKKIAIMLTILFMFLVLGCGEEGMDMPVGFTDDQEDPPETLQGMALLENMDDHGSIRVEMMEIDLSLLTDQDGSYTLPSEIADGEWTLRASYPYFGLAERAFDVFGGVPESDLATMELTQEVVFDVVPDNTFYTHGETVTITLTVHNVAGQEITLSSSTSPMTAFAVRRDGQTVVGGLFPGQGVEPQSVTLAAGQSEDFILNWTIDNPELEPGEYKIYALLTVSGSYPDYFSQNSELAAQLNESLYSKLAPATIIIQ